MFSIKYCNVILYFGRNVHKIGYVELMCKAVSRQWQIILFNYWRRIVCASSVISRVKYVTYLCVKEREQ